MRRRFTVIKEKVLQIYRVVGVLTIIAMAFFIGKGCTPEPKTKYITIEKEKIVEVPVEKIVYIDRIVYKTIYKEKEDFSPDKKRVVQIDEFKPTYKKHRVYIGAGIGPGEYDVETVGGGNSRVRQKFDDFIFGAGYQYNLDGKYNIGVQGISNKTFLLNFGKDF